MITKSIVQFVCLLGICFPSMGYAFSSGDGSKEAPFEISGNDDWRELNRMVSSNSMSTYEKYFILTNDITVDYCIGASNNNVFYGSIDGNGHSILLNLDVSMSSMRSVGIFSSVNNATFKNLIVKGVINLYSSDNDRSIGGVCGKAVNSSFINCFNHIAFDYTNCRYTRIVYAGGFCGEATSCDFIDCSNNATIKAYGYCKKKCAGGIVGLSDGCIYRQCSNSGTISGQTSMSTYQPDNIYTGGLVGESASDIIMDCFNTGNISSTLETDLTYTLPVNSATGGLIGYSDGTEMTKSYNVGSITGTYKGSFTNSYSSYVGGLYGHATSLTTKASSCFVDCFIIVPQRGRYGLIGVGGTPDNCYAASSCTISKGSGALGYGSYIECQSSDVRSQEWLSSTLSYDFNQYWWQSHENMLPSLKLEPTIQLRNVNLKYGIAIENFAISNNTLSSLEISSLDGKLDILNNTITPISSGTASLKIEQRAHGQWKSSIQIYDFAVAKKELLVKAPTLSCQYGSDIPAIELSYDGFVLGDNESHFIIEPIVSCEVTNYSNVGIYPITISGGEIENYSLKHINGEFSISKANQTILWEQVFEDVKVGDALRLTAVSSAGLPVNYSSSNDKVASIKELDGVIYLKLLAPGEVYIYAQQDGNDNFNEADKISKRLDIVSYITGINILPSFVILHEAEKIQLFPSIIPDNATEKTVVWSSSDENIAVVDADGNVTAFGVGEAVITATASDGSGVSASCSVTVNPILVESLTLSSTSWSGKVGETFMLGATVLPEDATDKSVAWSSSDENIATVDAGGNVTAVSVGEAIITATATDGSEASASCSATVLPILAESLTVSHESWSGKVGETFMLGATVLPEDATDKSVAWSSSDENIAIVDAEGNVTAVSVGEATIAATAADGSGISASCHVTVLPVLAESLTVTPDSWDGMEGDSFTLVATVLPENATDKSVSWSSSNSEIVTVDAEGNVHVLKDGYCTITVSTLDGSNLSAECVITSVSGIDAIFKDANASFDIYNLQGVLIKEGCHRDDLKQLPTGAYILRQGNTRKKIMIR